jgi:rhodanese-related sulfurtransferase
MKGRSMSSYTSISPDKLVRLIGTVNAPALVDVRLDEDFAADPRLIPGAQRRSHLDGQVWAPTVTGRSVVVICHKGQKLSEGTAAWLRNSNVAAEVLEGGHLAWTQAELPTVPADRIPRRDERGRTVWVTRERPKIDRIACPPLRRSQRRVPVRRVVRGRSRCRTLRRHRVRHRERVLEPSRGVLHL